MLFSLPSAAPLAGLLADEQPAFDACCLICFGVADILGEVLRALPRPGVLTLDVQREVRSVALEPLISAGLLIVTDVSGEKEESLLLSLASLGCDNGEASSAAVALSRSLSLATDDETAIKRVRRVAPTARILTTPELLKHWADAQRPPDERLAQIVRDIAEKGHYVPPNDHPLLSWWESVGAVPSSPPKKH